MSDGLRNRLFAAHGWLLAAAIWLTAQESDRARIFALPLCAVINAALWFFVTRRRVGVVRISTVLRRLPLLLVLPSLYFAGISVRFAVQSNSSIAAVIISMVSCLLVFLVTAIVYSETEDAGPLLFGLAAAGAFICFEGLAHEFTKTHGFVDLFARSPYRRDIAEDQITRLSYPIAYPNALATVLLLFSACSLGAFVAAKRLPVRLALGFVLLLNCGCIVLTGSRGGLISLLFLAFAYAGRQIGGGRWIVAAGVTLTIAAIGWMLRKPYAKLRGSGSLLQRAHGWVVTLRIVTRSPWFGEGPEAFRKEWAGYGPAHGYANQFGLDGFYANLLCEGGIVSLTVLSTLIIAAARETKRLLYSALPKRLQDALYYVAAGLGAVLIHNVVESTLSSPPVVLACAMLFGLATALRCREIPGRAAKETD